LSFPTGAGERPLLTWQAMERRTVQLRVAGQSYRVVTTAPEADLKRFVASIEERLSQVTPRGRPVSPQAMLLAALSLAHDLDEANARVGRVQERARETLSNLVARIDAALEDEDGGTAQAVPSPPPSP
jgi:cell division protein ZapA